MNKNIFDKIYAFSRKSFIIESVITTLFSSVLSISTFGIYNYFAVIQPMKEIYQEQNRTINEQKLLIQNQQQLIEKINNKLNARWW
jgi:hypothetical protein